MEMASEQSRTGEPSTPSIAVNLNVNILCIVGASIGIIALFLAWIHEPPTMPSPPDIRYEPTIAYMVSHEYLYYGASVAFLAGTVAAFVTPLGGIVQAGGLLAFAAGIIDSGGDPWLDGIDPQQELRAGMYLGIASCTLVITSLFSPLGTGRLRPGRQRKIEPKERMMTVSRSKGES